MAGTKKKKFLLDKARLLFFATLGLIVMLFYIALVGKLGNNVIYVLIAILLAYLYLKVPSNRNKLFLLINKLQIKRLVSKVPSIIWGGFAVFGLVIFGILVGIALSTDMDKKDSDEFHKKKEDSYINVINAYQDLSRLQYLQSQDMEIMTDVASWYDHPEEIYDAIQSYKQKRDELLFQYGKIYELRKQANLPKDDNLTTD